MPYKANHSLADTALAQSFAGLVLKSAQQQRVAEFVKIGLPHPREENWRWTDIHGGIRKGVEGANTSQIAASSVKLSGAIQNFVPFSHQLTDPISLLAGALADDEALADYVIEQTPATALSLQTNHEAGLGGSHVQLRIKSGCDVVLFEQIKGPASGLAVDVRQIVLEPGAHLSRVLLCGCEPDQTRIHQAFIELGKGASYTQFTLDFGARLSRVETDITYCGPNSKAVLNGAYLLAGEGRCDATSLVHHKHPGCVTRQLHKGVILDQAQAVFQGKFHVTRLGQQTDAQMGHHALLLSEQARVRAKPELEIYADDVACAHGNTTGALDKDALFYMRQRGLSEADAKRLLTRAFVVEAVQVLPQDIQDQICNQIDQWLERPL